MARTGRPLKDLSGKTFGKLKVNRRVSNVGDHESIYECVCSCGNTVNNTATELKSKIHCGCVPCKFEDLSGRKFGSWKVNFPDYRQGAEKIKFDCTCDCGNSAKVLSESLLSGKSLSCGCWQSTVVSLPEGAGVLNKNICIYRNSAKKRGYSFNLQNDEIIKLFNGNCFYCNSAPSNETKTRKKGGKSLIYSGIDRIDNKIGYDTGNVVSCCKMCNWAKRTLSQSEFLSWIEQVHNHQLSKL
jgi:hypothetical protein